MKESEEMRGDDCEECEVGGWKESLRLCYLRGGESC